MMMRSFRGISILILILLIVVPIYIACSSSKSAINKDQGNYIDRIETSLNENGTTIDIIGKDIKHYNAFQLHDKNKLIIDLPDAKFHQVPTLDEAKVGCIEQIKVLQFADEERQLTRIEVDLSSEVYPEFKEDSDHISINLMHQDIGSDAAPSTSIASLEPANVLNDSDKSSESIATKSVENNNESSTSKEENPVEESNEAERDIDLATSESLTEDKIETEDVAKQESKIAMNDSETSEPVLPVGDEEKQDEAQTSAQESKTPEEKTAEETKPDKEVVPPQEPKQPVEEKPVPEITPPLIEKPEVEQPVQEEDVNEIFGFLKEKDKVKVDEQLPEELATRDIIPDVPVSWYLRDAGLREFLRLVAKEYNFNLVIDPEVSANITVHLDKVPLASALATVLKSYGFGIEIRESIVRVGTLERLSKERENEATMKQNMKMTVELKKESRSLNYASAKDLKTIVEKLLTKNRTDAFAAVDDRTNTLLVYDTPDNLKVIWDWVEKLDRQTKQVYIQARIVQTTKKFARSLGIQWGGTYVADASHGNTTGYRFPNSVSLAGAAGAAVAGAGGGLIPAAVNLPTSDLNSGIGVLLGDTLDTVKLDIALNASETDNETKILSTPRVTTSDNVAGSIKFGQEYPYQTRDQNGALVTSFKETVTSIKVTPHTTNDNFIKMNIEVTKDSFAGFTPQGIVFLNKNEAKMEVLVSDGDTAVIGGLNTSNVANTNEQVPLFHKIPVLGWLFKKKIKTNEKDDILIFLTPHIIR